MSKATSLSVCMITYNHEHYIRKAISGVLEQESDLRIELVIGEDFSTDGTRAICEEFQRKFPDKVRLLERSTNVGMSRNLIDTLANCTGEYVAICEGDDYWTDPNKLQTQADYLIENPDFAVSFHRVKVQDDLGKVDVEYPSSAISEVTDFEDLAIQNYIPTLSVMFRNGLFGRFPEELANLPVGDYPLHLLNAQFGKIKYFPTVMGVYRMHAGGAWSQKKDAEMHEKWLKVAVACKNYFYPKGNSAFTAQIVKANTELCFIYFAEGDFRRFRQQLITSLKYFKFIKPRTSLALCIRLLLSFFPPIARGYGRLTKGRISSVHGFEC